MVESSTDEKSILGGAGELLNVGVRIEDRGRLIRRGGTREQLFYKLNVCM